MDQQSGDTGPLRDLLQAADQLPPLHEMSDLELTEWCTTAWNNFRDIWKRARMWTQFWSVNDHLSPGFQAMELRSQLLKKAEQGDNLISL